jgi:hypothetical protein
MPATLRIPHTPVMRQRPPGVTASGTGHYESNLFNVKQMVGSDSIRRLISDMFDGANDRALTHRRPIAGAH